MQKKNLFYFFILPLLVSVVLLVFLKDKPAGDFGNYYYGSKLWKEGKDLHLIYSDIHWFNDEVSKSGEKDFFGNYSPVPPFSLIFYWPLTFLNCAAAKLLFSFLSILLFCISFFRFAKYKQLDPKHFLSLAVLALPLYNNLLQGQSYLLITAALLEIWIAYKGGKNWIPALLIALIFQLKFFPAFVLIYFLFRKEFKIVFMAVGFITLLTAVTFLITDGSVVGHYYSDIFPRLLKNEIIDPFYYGHQGLNIMLNNLFVHDELSNPDPLFHSNLMAGIIEGALVGIIICFIYSIIKKNASFKGYDFTLFCGILIGKYLTSYSLILLLPFVISLFDYKYGILILVLLMVCCNLPLQLLENMPDLIRFERIILMFIVFIIAMAEYRFKVNFALLLTLCVLFSAVNVFFGKRQQNDYYMTENKPGIPYRLSIHNNSLVLMRCLGSKDYADTIPFPARIVSSRQLDPVKNEYVINDSLVVYLSDFQQGVGMNKLRKKVIRH
ncbi:MAG: hypothetical protein K0S12_1022 [Bacteroidetes bacterium]|nr:hypothetical protein [Bacteroidota bacterium]